METEQKVLLFIVAVLLAVGLARLASPAPTSTPLSSLATPSAAPTAAPSGNCQVQVQDLTASPGAISTTGTVAVPAAALHTMQVKIISPNALNAVTVNGATPVGWGSLASGFTTQFTVDTTGVWTFVVTNGNCISNAVSVQGY